MTAARLADGDVGEVASVADLTALAVQLATLANAQRDALFPAALARNAGVQTIGAGSGATINFSGGLSRDAAGAVDIGFGGGTWTNAIIAPDPNARTVRVRVRATMRLTSALGAIAAITPTGTGTVLFPAFPLETVVVIAAGATVAVEVDSVWELLPGESVSIAAEEQGATNPFNVEGDAFVEVTPDALAP